MNPANLHALLLPGLLALMTVGLQAPPSYAAPTQMSDQKLWQDIPFRNIYEITCFPLRDQPSDKPSDPPPKTVIEFDRSLFNLNLSPTHRFDEISFTNQKDQPPKTLWLLRAQVRGSCHQRTSLFHLLEPFTQEAIYLKVEPDQQGQWLDSSMSPLGTESSIRCLVRTNCPDVRPSYKDITGHSLFRLD